MELDRHDTDILILGAGGAGLFAALHALQTAPDLEVTIAVKGLLGKCGCTRMVQGGYNVALGSAIRSSGISWTPSRAANGCPIKDMAWRLCETAVTRAHPGAGKRGRLLFRPQRRWLSASKGLCRPDRRSHGAQGRSHRHRDHQPPDGAGSGALASSSTRGTPRRRADPRAGRRWFGWGALHRHPHWPLPPGARQDRPARHWRRPDHVSLSHAVGRQVDGWPCHGAARGTRAARHGNGAVPPDRAARRRGHAHDRHGAGGGPARGRRLSAERRPALHVRL